MAAGAAVKHTRRQKRPRQKKKTRQEEEEKKRKKVGHKSSQISLLLPRRLCAVECSTAIMMCNYSQIQLPHVVASVPKKLDNTPTINLSATITSRLVKIGSRCTAFLCWIQHHRHQKALMRLLESGAPPAWPRVHILVYLCAWRWSAWGTECQG